jgi:hypothetical protein
MRPAAATPARPPSLKQLEARASRAQAARQAAWEKVMKARAALYAGLSAALDSFNDSLGHETAAFQVLCAARQGRAAETPAPPAPETLTSADEED